MKLTFSNDDGLQIFPNFTEAVQQLFAHFDRSHLAAGAVAAIAALESFEAARANFGPPVAATPEAPTPPSATPIPATGDEPKSLEPLTEPEAAAT